MDIYTRRDVHGVENLVDLDGPVIFVANHGSHMDTPVLLRTLPGRWRRRTAVAAATDYFYASRGLAVLVSTVFGTVPIDRRGGGLGGGSAAHLDALLEGHRSLIVYAEGTRSHDGRIARLRSGAAALAMAHEIPVVPVYVSGTRAAMPRGRRWMVFKQGAPGSRRHTLEVRFGAPIHARAGDHRRDVMERVRLFLAESGGRTGTTELPTDDRARDIV